MQSEFQWESPGATGGRTGAEVKKTSDMPAPEVTIFALVIDATLRPSTAKFQKEVLATHLSETNLRLGIYNGCNSNGDDRVEDG